MNLAPSDGRTHGSGLDLPLALGVLVASKQLDAAAVAGFAAVGELGLDGSIRPVPGLVSLAEAMTARYLAAFPTLDPADLRAAYAVLGAQRSAKILGIFTRLCRRDGKPHYLRHIPRVWRLLEGDLSHPALADLDAWFARHLPPARRRVPDEGGAA